MWHVEKNRAPGEIPPYRLRAQLPRGSLPERFAWTTDPVYSFANRLHPTIYRKKNKKALFK